MRARVGEIEIDFAANEVVYNDVFARRTEPQCALVFENVPGFLKFFQIALINFSALALEIRSEVSADVRAFVPIHAQPLEPLVNRVRGFLGVPFEIGVFDS